MYRVSPRCVARPVRPGGWVRSTLAVRSLASATTTASSKEGQKTVYPPNFKPPDTIAVLGGGLTGLTTAWYLSRWIPKAKIVIYEASDRLGGWIDTKTVPVTTPDGKTGTASFERGARMVQIYRQGVPKFDDMVFYEMIEELDLQDEVLRIPRKSPMKNYIYFPDHMVELPSAGTSLLELLQKTTTEPLFRGLLKALYNGWANSWANLEVPSMTAESVKKDSETITYWGVNYCYDPMRNDRSVGELYSTYTGQPEVVDNILSAMIHGIWGGDVSRLSAARDPLGNLVNRPAVQQFPDHVSLYPEELDLPHSMVCGKKNTGEKGSYNPDWTVDAVKHGQLCFKSGFSTLTRALVAALEKNPMVTIKTNQPVTALHKHATGLPTIVSKGQVPQLFKKVISTINANTLASITRGKLPSLANSHAVTIQAVNLWYPTPNLNAPYHGFGYLIPKTIKHEQNPECALGVLFDSDRERIAGYSPDTVPGTKLTVLLGGHYWDELPPEFRPNQAQAIEMAKAVVARHLGIPKHENDRAVASTKLCQGCIPQHYVGHWSRMAQADAELKQAFGGNVAVAGPSYQAPGVMGSIRAARELAWYTAGFYPDDGDALATCPVGEAGLDRFSVPRDYMVICRKRFLPMRFASHHLQSMKPSLFEYLKTNYLPDLLRFFKPRSRWHFSDSWNIRLVMDCFRLEKIKNEAGKRAVVGTGTQPWIGHNETANICAELLHACEGAVKAMEELERREHTEMAAEAKRVLTRSFRAEISKPYRRLVELQKQRDAYYHQSDNVLS
ncbi:hypothetical protein B0T14DRAFT_559708 [Immersiella caudata]|uniref:Amine oxidase domain-containing protein n=1 Tax=Immersiella caudata TaxID=314043 RepID=A0AA40CAV1_9PEZI|nr:hypothetical protein B0T14DRAFT_559708 [Immersiella caudata]